MRNALKYLNFYSNIITDKNFGKGNLMNKKNKIFSLLLTFLLIFCTFSLCLLCACDKGEHPDDDPKNQTSEPFTVMSFNIRTTSENRGERLKTVIKRNDPDILGLQEVSKHWQPIFSSLEGYSKVGIGRDNGGSGSDEAGYILYKTDKFELSEKDSGTCWYNPDSSQMNEPYTQPESAYPRIFTYALLTRKSDDQKLLMVNTHLPLHWVSRKDAANILAAWLETNYSDVPQIITGDFNTASDRIGKYGEYIYINPIKSGVGDDIDFDTIMIDKGFRNARFDAPANRTDNRATYPTNLYPDNLEDCYDKENGDILDYCLVKGDNIKVLSYSVDRDPIGNANKISGLGDDASDHYPIVINLKLS